MKVGCSTYSYHRNFEAGKIDLEGFLEKMFRFNVDGVELLDLHVTPDPGNLRRLKRLGLKLGIETAAVTIHPSLEVESISPPESNRVAEPTKKIDKWIEIASLMGAPVLRVDVIRTPKEMSQEEAIKVNIDSVKRCIPHAVEKGITMGIENHGGVTSNAENIIKIVKGVGSEWYGVVLDFGNFGLEERAYEEMEKVARYAMFCHAKTLEFGLASQGLEPHWEEKRIDYRKIMDILRRRGYNGYLSLEYEGDESEGTAVPKGIGFLRRLVQAERGSRRIVGGKNPCQKR